MAHFSALLVLFAVFLAPEALAQSPTFNADDFKARSADEPGRVAIDGIKLRTFTDSPADHIGVVVFGDVTSIDARKTENPDGTVEYRAVLWGSGPSLRSDEQFHVYAWNESVGRKLVEWNDRSAPRVIVRAEVQKLGSTYHVSVQRVLWVGRDGKVIDSAQ